MLHVADCASPKRFCSDVRSDKGQETTIVGSLGIHLGIQMECLWAWQLANVLCPEIFIHVKLLVWGIICVFVCSGVLFYVAILLSFCLSLFCYSLATLLYSTPIEELCLII